jgi:hypothetical protein
MDGQQALREIRDFEKEEAVARKGREGQSWSRPGDSKSCTRFFWRGHLLPVKPIPSNPLEEMTKLG